MDDERQFQLAKKTAFFDHLGIVLEEAKDGYARLRLPFRPELAHPYGYFHGGAVASLADSAGVNAVFAIPGQSGNVATLEMKINFLVPVKDDVIYAEGRVIHQGGTVALSDVEVKDSRGRIIAKALVTCALRA